MAKALARPIERWQSLAEVPRPSKLSFEMLIESSNDGVASSVPVNVISGSRPGPVVVAVAGHHGDEHEGPTTLLETWEHLEPTDVAGTLILIPVLNPAAFRLAQRLGPDDGVDINRVFPGDPAGTITSRIASTFFECIAKGADFIISMHGWSAGYEVEPYIEYPVISGGDGVAMSSRDAALAFGLRYLNPLDAGPGRLLSEASGLGIPIIEIEIGGQGVSRDSRRELYETGFRSVLIHLGLIEGLQRATGPATYIERVDCTATVGGILRPSVAIGDHVTAGEPLAKIYDLNLSRQEAVACPCDGTVGIIRLAASLTPGQLIATIFRAIGASAGDSAAADGANDD